MNFGLNIGQVLIITFLFLTTINCAITYLCSSSALKTLDKTGSFPMAINKIRVYDKYLLTLLTFFSSAVYVVVSYYYFLDLLKDSDYFITLSVLVGFIFSVFTTFFSRLCYCYACNVLLKTKLNEYECFKENFLYLLRIFFPIFLISFVIPIINILPIGVLYRNILVAIFLLLYLFNWILMIPLKTILTLNAKQIKSKKLKNTLSKLFEENGIRKYKLYYWDSSRSNEANAFISGNFKYYLFVSSTLIESITNKELEAVVLHEIGHVKNHHFRKLFFWKLVILIFVSIILYYTIIVNSNGWLIFGLVFALILTMGANLKGNRKYEDEADLFVNSKGYGKELVSALKKISFEDASINKVDELFSSHPDVNKRIDKLKENNLRVLCVGFKGENNSSCQLINNLSNKIYDKVYVRNSFQGSIEDLENIYNKKYNYILIFGMNKDLKNEIRIEKTAMGEQLLTTSLDVESIKNKLLNEKMKVTINEEPTNYLCNNLYNHILEKTKKAILIHIPSISKIGDFELLVSLIDNLFE